MLKIYQLYLAIFYITLLRIDEIVLRKLRNWITFCLRRDIVVESHCDFGEALTKIWPLVHFFGPELGPHSASPIT